MKYILPLIVLIQTACSSSKASYPELIKIQEKRPIVFKNVNFFDGENENIQIGRDVFIKDGIIEKIEYGRKDKTYEGYDIIEGKGKYLIPGLIDAHVHIQNNGSAPWHMIKANLEENLKANLYCGVTTVMDLGGFAGKSHKLNERVIIGEIAGPNIYNTHVPITVKNAHPIPAAQEAMPFPLNKMANTIVPTAKDTIHSRKLIQSYCKQKIDYVKIIYDELPLGSVQMKYEILKSLIDETHKLGYKAIVHIGSVTNALNAVQAGADVLAHGIVRGKLKDDEAKLIADSKVPMVYTLTGHQLTADMSQGKFIPTKWDSIVMPEELLNSVGGENGKAFNTFEVMGKFAKTCVQESKDWKHNVQLLIKHGATILVGTDAGVAGAYPGTITLAEFKTLSELGVDNISLLRNTTYNAAMAFVEKASFGKITQGFEADLLLLNRNPLQDIEAVFEPELIMSNGVLIERVM